MNTHRIAAFALACLAPAVFAAPAEAQGRGETQPSDVWGDSPEQQIGMLEAAFGAIDSLPPDELKAAMLAFFTEAAALSGGTCNISEDEVANATRPLSALFLARLGVKTVPSDASSALLDGPDNLTSVLESLAEAAETPELAARVGALQDRQQESYGRLLASMNALVDSGAISLGPNGEISIGGCTG